MGIEIPHKIFYTNNICIKEESRKDSYDEENLNPYVNKSIHFEELQKRIKYHRKNSAPEYLFDEKSRKLFYSILYLKKEEEKNVKENIWTLIQFIKKNRMICSKERIILMKMNLKLILF